MSNRLYVGVKSDLNMERFRSKETPVRSSHGHLYAAVIGPFRTVAGAEYMVNFGKGNPHCQTVSQAERLGRINKAQSELCKAELDRLSDEIRKSRPAARIIPGIGGTVLIV